MLVCVLMGSSVRVRVCMRVHGRAHDVVCACGHANVW